MPSIKRLANALVQDVLRRDLKASRICWSSRRRWQWKSHRRCFILDHMRNRGERLFGRRSPAAPMECCVSKLPEFFCGTGFTISIADVCARCSTKNGNQHDGSGSPRVGGSEMAVHPFPSVLSLLGDRGSGEGERGRSRLLFDLQSLLDSCWKVVESRLEQCPLTNH